MKKRDAIILAATFVILSTLLGVYFFTRYSGSGSKKAAAFQVETLEGEILSFESQSDKVLLLDFMSVTCTVCKEMNPVLNNIWGDSSIKENVTIITLEIDSFTTKEELENYKQEYNISWYVAFASDSMVDDYNVISLPTFVIINKEGMITFHDTGFVDEDTLRTVLQQTINGELGGTEITTRSEFTIGFAVLTGIASFFSPCAFPLLPSYLAHIIGQDQKQKKEQDEESTEEQDSETSAGVTKEEHKGSSPMYLLIGSIGGVGILISYGLLGVLITVVGGSIKKYVPYLVPIIGGLLILFGISMFTNFSLQFNSIQQWINKKQRKLNENKKKREFIKKINQTFLYGIGYGLASLGCNAPIFFAFALQISSLSVIKIIFGYIAFSLTIIFLMAFATLLISLSRDALLKKIKNATDIIKKVASVIIILVGIYLLLEFFLLS
ncbi:MAG: sulfite exporter TauE/SafE family protein [Candidatus Heimdallarchaeum endolithica]|uniref:Sulfite exporter TauE/SafE family protein n=1 Tax=Candidatus Heimdallarchaeum endolithica TaxID=2876572 RepID=A0A9Y1BPC2_9ARCH|nr:MAG: sulfite exporter TauE/SafE family protein [Candidatus Heimdallarchaeum endolithica]